MIPNLKVGQQLTIFTIDSILAMTHRRFIEIQTVELEPKRAGFDNSLRLGTYRERGRRRKEFFLDLPNDALVFDGWDVPFTADTDSEAGMISGNACLNLVGDPAVIREWMSKQLNSEVGDQVKAKILVWPAVRSNLKVQPKLLYPELETSHAVIETLKARPPV